MELLTSLRVLLLEQHMTICSKNKVRELCIRGSKFTKRPACRFDKG